MTTTPAVHVICDVRELSEDIQNEDQVKQLWQRFAPGLVNRPLRQGQSLKLSTTQGPLVLWIVDCQGLTQVRNNTPFVIVDVLRNPTLLYRCRKCGSYGPFRCVECLREGNGVEQGSSSQGHERLCVKHARPIDNRMRIYCEEHQPACSCPNPHCPQKAKFFCQNCHRYFGEHYKNTHPVDKDIDYCYDCYQSLFSLCEDCQPEPVLNRHKLGRLQCYFRTHEMTEMCGKRLCWEHGQQWKIWGPHYHGITLCKTHKGALPNANAADVLAMILTARPPLRGQVFSLTDPFHLRRVLNHGRAEPLTFSQIEQAMQELHAQATKWKDGAARQRFLEVRQRIEIVLKEQDRLLQKVKAFYGGRIGYITAGAITLSIERNMAATEQPARYAVVLEVPGDRYLFIGRGGSLVEKLRKDLALGNVSVREVAERSQ